MECKCNISHIHIAFRVELIDTLWNVNILFISKSLSVIVELIDTLWNVNIETICEGIDLAVN